MGTITQHLRMLRDVEGVHGSFVFAGGGALVDSDLPAIFDTDLLGEVGARIARLYETFFSGGGDMETCVLRYAEHKLYIRKMAFGTIGVLSTVGVNLPALRMVANLVARRVDPEIAAIASPLTNSGFSTATRSGASAPTKTLPSPASAAATAAYPASMPEHDPIPIIPEDGRDSSVPSNDRHVLMYRGRPIEQ
jgi:predicted regulator of Ras-like GTPase activity (Roadblock/LC7/MglB family)